MYEVVWPQVLICTWEVERLIVACCHNFANLQYPSAQCVWCLLYIPFMICECGDIYAPLQFEALPRLFDPAVCV